MGQLVGGTWFSLVWPINRWTLLDTATTHQRCSFAGCCHCGRVLPQCRARKGLGGTHVGKKIFCIVTHHPVTLLPLRGWAPSPLPCYSPALVRTAKPVHTCTHIPCVPVWCLLTANSRPLLLRSLPSSPFSTLPASTPTSMAPCPWAAAECGTAAGGHRCSSSAVPEAKGSRAGRSPAVACAGSRLDHRG